MLFFLNRLYTSHAHEVAGGSNRSQCSTGHIDRRALKGFEGTEHKVVRLVSNIVLECWKGSAIKQRLSRSDTYV